MSEEATARERPATFAEVFAGRQYRAIFVASALSWIGDYMARAAVTVLVYDQTQSVALSAASFAISYLPWVLGGPLLATLAERRPYRAVMVLCDLVRMVLVAALAIPGLPIAVMLALLLLAMLANPPDQAARSALMPLILSRDRLVVGLAVLTSTGQAAQVGGYALGAATAAVNPRWALLFNAVTFGVSAAVIRRGVAHHPPARTREQRRALLRETADGFRLVFGTPVLRAIAVIVFAVMLFAVVPEGLAAAWAERTSSSEGTRGLAQGLIMGASPVGFIVGGLVVGRLVPPATRRRLVRPFAVLAPLSLVPSLLAPPFPVVAAMAAVAGFAVAGMIPTVNGMFVLALPNGFRARAFGVMQSGVQLTQGFAVLATGLLAERFALPTVVGVWSAAGVVLMLAVAIRWPRPEQFDSAIANANPPAPDSTGGDPLPADGPAARPADRPAARPADGPTARPAAHSASG